MSLPTSDWQQKLIHSRCSPFCSTASWLTTRHIFLHSHGFRTPTGRGDRSQNSTWPRLELQWVQPLQCCCFTSHFLGADTGILFYCSSGRCPSHKITVLASVLALIFHQSIQSWCAVIGIVNSLMVRPHCYEKHLDLPKLQRVRFWKQVFHLLGDCSNQCMMGGTCPQTQVGAKWETQAPEHT